MSENGDRRDNSRAQIELKVEYKRLNSFFADYTRNISRGGTFIKTGKPLKIGTEFMFKLCVPKLEAPLVLRGKVQWIVQEADSTEEQPAGMGIGFVYASEAERERIERVVQALRAYKAFPTGLAMTVEGDPFARRAHLLAERRRTDDWFFEFFGMTC